MRIIFRRAVLFLAVFAALQALWAAGRGTWIERVWIEDLTVRSATLIINALSPAAHAEAKGSRIAAAGGGLNILQGCEGVEVVFMLAAAFVAFPMRARLRLYGLASGLVFVFALNQLRILALFYAFRNDRQLFDLLHTTVAPLVLIVLTGLFFHFWAARAQRAGAPTLANARQQTASVHSQ